MKHSPYMTASGKELSDQQIKGLDELMGAFDAWDAISKLTDQELSDAVQAEVWGKCTGFNTREDFLLSEMIDRFDKRAGIERPEETEE